jgi:hypothetical protein
MFCLAERLGNSDSGQCSPTLQIDVLVDWPTTTQEIVMLQIGTRAPWGFGTCHGMTGMK